MRTGLLIALGIIIGSTLSTFIASAWTAPTATPPGANVSSPVNVGGTMQLKSGTLGVNGLGVFGNTILNGTNGDGTGNGVNSYINFGATTGQSGYGIRDNNGTLEFKNLSSSWASLNVTLTNLLQVNGITPNGIGQITSIKFGDGTTQTTAAIADPWSTNGTKIYYNGGNVGVGTQNPDAPITVLASGETSDAANDIHIVDYTNANINPGFVTFRARGTSATPSAVKAGDWVAGFAGSAYNGTTFPFASAGMTVSAEADATPTSDPLFISFWTVPPNSASTYERLHIAGNGYVGIGTGAPAQQLDITGNQYIEGGAIYFKDGYNGANQMFYLENWNNAFYICNATNFSNTGCALNISHAGNAAFTGYISATTYYSTSDARLKMNIQTLENGLEVVKHLRGVTFNWKKDGTPSAGVIAQEVEKVLPSAVTTDSKTGMKSVNYDELIAPLIESVKDIASLSDTFKHTLIAWFGDTQNGIEKINTKELCINSGTAQTCITQQQLAALLASRETCKTQ